jgi:hypothetical protein
VQVFERLKNRTDVAEQQRQQDELDARLHAQQHKSQERLVELVCTITYCGSWWKFKTSDDDAAKASTTADD